MLKNYLKLAAAVLVSEGVGIIGSFFTAPAIPGWYQGLNKPEFAPPNWVFAPVWTALFLLMGIAAWLVWKKGFDRQDVKVALGVFLGQLVLNLLWSIIFFGSRNPGFAFAEIVLLWLTILLTVVSFWKISKLAAWLLLPYLLWVTFAAVLNFAIWRIN